MTHHVPDMKPGGPLLFREEGKGGLELYSTGLRAYFASISYEDVSGWTRGKVGRHVVATLAYRFVPWSHVTGVYRMRVEDHGSSQKKVRVFHVCGIPIDLTDMSGIPRRYMALQVETVDLRSTVIAIREGDLAAAKALRRALDDVWHSLYRSEEVLSGTLWDERYEVWDSHTESYHYYFDEYGSGDVFKPAEVRSPGEDDVMWF